MTDQPARTPYCTKIRYGITGAPILDGDEMDGSHAPGVGIAPKLIELIYSAARDGKAASVSASVTGTWTRFGERADGQMTTHFTDGPDGWPAWLAEEARLHDPAVSSAGVVQLPPTNQAAPSRRAGLRDEIAAALEAADYRMDMRRGDLADAVLPVLYREWPWLRAEAEEDEELTAQEARDLADELSTELYRAQDALAFVEECCVIADREQQPVTTSDVREWLKGARCGRQMVADGRAPELPPLDQDPVARRLGLLPAPVDGAAVYRALADQQTQLAVADDLARRRDMAAARRQLVKELRRLAAEATPEPAELAADPWADGGRLAQTGIDTPGCDCGHNGMGEAWHGDACEWKSLPPCDHCKVRGHSFEDCPAAEVPATEEQDDAEADTFPAWLAQRFDPQGAPWDAMSDDDRSYWEHHARAVRRAVERNGFREPAAQPHNDETPDSDPIESSIEAALGQAEEKLRQVLGVAEVIEANGIGWAADSVRRAAKGELS